MPKWLRKTLVVLVTTLTFGLVTPSQLFLLDAVEEKQPKRNTVETKPVEKASVQTELQLSVEQYTEREQIISQLLKDAEAYSYTKFGSRIKPVIEDEFRTVILPNIEKAIEEVATSYEEVGLQQLVITEMPTGGNSEKIFHIANNESKEDIIRFHVRRDHPPQEGFWFNFHYHTSNDNFQAHHELGSIYWDTNTPPKWLS